MSVTSIIAKVREKIAHNQFYLYLQNENILSPSQHGFRQGHSTVACSQPEIFKVAGKITVC